METSILLRLDWEFRFLRGSMRVLSWRKNVGRGGTVQGGGGAQGWNVVGGGGGGGINN